MVINLQGVIYRGHIECVQWFVRWLYGQLHLLADHLHDAPRCLHANMRLHSGHLRAGSHCAPRVHHLFRAEALLRLVAGPHCHRSAHRMAGQFDLSLDAILMKLIIFDTYFAHFCFLYLRSFIIVKLPA